MRIFAGILVFMFMIAGTCAAAGFEELMAEGQAAYKAGQFSKAGELLRLAGDDLQKRKDQRAPLLWGNAAIAYMKDKDYATAADLYERILSQKNPPKDKLRQYYSNLVLCRAELGERALEISAIDRMLKAIPRLPADELAEVYARLGDAYRSLELYGAAASSYEKAAQLLPPDTRPEQRARILTALGLSQGNMGDYGAAGKNLQEARKMAAQLGEAQSVAEAESNLGLLYREKGDYVEAMKLLQSALEIEKKANLTRRQGVEHNNIGLVAASTGNFDKAMQHFQQSLAIAQKERNVRDEAIATVNRAYVYRLAGNLEEALQDYSKAGALFEKAGFQEGQATTLLGSGKVAFLEMKDYDKALQSYEKALEIYKKLDLPRWQAVTLLNMADVYKRMASPGRTTRDLLVDADESAPAIPRADALAKAQQYYAQCLSMAEKMGLRELIWAANQGLGYVDLQEGRLEAALKRYQKAIELVTQAFVSMEDAQMLGEYMAEKEELYNEAAEVCAALYEKTRDKKYLELQMQYTDTLRNEIQKASAALVKLNFDDPAKQKRYEEIYQMGKAKAQAAKNLVVTPPAADASKEEKARYNEAVKNQKAQLAQFRKLDADYNKLLAQWKKDYKGDQHIFDSAARLDLGDIQKALKPDEIFINYTVLDKKIMIILVTSKDIEMASAPDDTGREELDNLIKKDFLVNYIEKYGHAQQVTLAQEKEYLRKSSQTLNKLYKILIEPVHAKLKNYKRAYISADGFLATVPFAALVTNDDFDNPKYLVEEGIDFAYIRPSFLKPAIYNANTAPSKTLLAVGNPKNPNIVSLPPLPGAEREVKFLEDNIITNPAIKDVSYKGAASDTWFLKRLNGNDTMDAKPDTYDVIYFATHGVPYSEVFYSYDINLDKLKKAYGEKEIDKEAALVKKYLPERSPLNGYLYMSTDPSNEESSGFLTIKRILELPEKALDKTKFVALSACNTGVTFAPKTLKKDTTQDALKEANADMDVMAKNGWIPGVDQVSFVDTFMKRGVKNTYGTLWFASDEASSYLTSNMMTKMFDKVKPADPVAALNQTQREYLVASRGENKAKLLDAEGNYPVPIHPYFWAVGAMFGK